MKMGGICHDNGCPSLLAANLSEVIPVCVHLALNLVLSEKHVPHLPRLPLNSHEHFLHLEWGKHPAREIRQALHPQGTDFAHLRRDQECHIGGELKEKMVFDGLQRNGDIPGDKRRVPVTKYTLSIPSRV